MEIVFQVIFMPLFVEKVQLPSPLLMKVETSRLKTCSSLELAGRGIEKHLYLAGGDATHTITFQLGLFEPLFLLIINFNFISTMRRILPAVV